MSFLTSISGLLGGGTPLGPTAPTAALDAKSRPAAPPTGNAAQAATGGAAPGETTQTASRIPPVTETRTVNATTAARPGADGRADPAEADREDAARREDAAKREEEAALRDLLRKELLSRIPVPVAAIPKLAGDVEQVRAIGERDARGPMVAANDPHRPTDPAA
ncbi:hypothetical protein [Jannaschia formosa]|uniref:hypothetical protein n=1 Tax=Jannaschia formosa TaxID=2259592 RepID=UPI000E1C3C1E|nr:hypothetical protein [Jannaschia formosa]TFL16607.1 hypothetical protein DR046_19155 [Jannaschia formosa]